MPRCCQGGTCACLIQVGDQLSITGVGSAQEPYVIGVDLGFEVTDNDTFNLVLSGMGTSLDPWNLEVLFASTATLDGFPNVDTTGRVNGDVLGYNASTDKWEAQAPTTAATGAVSTDTSIDGDGSVGSPLVVVHDADGYTTTGGSGIGLTTEGKSLLNRRFGDAATRTALVTAPVLNQVTMLDTNPGQQDYWNGAAWLPVNNGVDRDLSGELLAMSGPYVDGLPVTLVVRRVVATTDSIGQFDVLESADLAGKSGVLTCHFQETGVVPFKAMVFDNVDHISATAYRLDDGTPLASQAIEGVVTAYIY